MLTTQSVRFIKLDTYYFTDESGVSVQRSEEILIPTNNITWIKKWNVTLPESESESFIRLNSGDTLHAKQSVSDVIKLCRDPK